MPVAGRGHRVEVDTSTLIELRGRIAMLAADVRTDAPLAIEGVFPQVVDDALRAYVARRAARLEDALGDLDDAAAALVAVVDEMRQADDALADGLQAPGREALPWVAVPGGGGSTGPVGPLPCAAPPAPGSGR